MTDASMVRRKKKFGGCWLAIVALLTVPLLLLCAFWVWSIQSEKRTQAQLEEIRQRGEPVTAAEMEEYYALEEGQVDTTDLWVTAFAALDSAAFHDDSTKIPIVGAGADGTPIPWVGEDWPQLEEVESLLEKYSESVQLMHSAAEQGGAARYDTDFSLGFQLLLPDVQRARQGARVLQLQARVHAHRGEPAEVKRCLISMLRLGDSIKQEPILVSQLVRTAIHGMAAAATGDALHDAKLTDEQMAELQQAFRELDVNEAYRRAFVGERFFGIHAMENGIGNAIGGPPIDITKYVKQDTATYFSLMARIINSMELPYAEAAVEGEALEADANELSGLRHWFSRMLVPSVTNITSARVRHDANNRMADVALAVGRFRLAEGELPEALSDCVPKFLPQNPVDPFNGGAMFYEIGEDGRSYRLSCTQPATSTDEEQEHSLKVGDWPDENADEEYDGENGGHGGEYDVHGEFEEWAEEGSEETSEAIDGEDGDEAEGREDTESAAEEVEN